MNESPVPVLFIGGLGRSGSTLLARMLGAVPGMASVGELLHIWKRGPRDGDRCACGATFDHCEFWSEVGLRAFGGWDRISIEEVSRAQQAIERDRFLPALMLNRNGETARSLESYKHYLVPLYRAIRDVTGAEVIVDSGKHASAAMVLHRIDGIDLRLVHLVRDSRGVAYSWTKQVARPERSDGAQMARWTPLHTATRYVAYNLVLQGMARTGTPTVRLKYEDLVTDPAYNLRRVLSLVGKEDALPEGLGLEAPDLPADHQIAGNPIRFDRGPIVLRIDDAWRSRLAVQSRLTVTAITWPLLAGYGYLGRQS